MATSNSTRFPSENPSLGTIPEETSKTAEFSDYSSDPVPKDHPDHPDHESGSEILFSSDLSLRKAINAKCKECIYDPYGGGGSWLKQIEDCTSRSCPLYPVRPLTLATTAERAEARRLQTGKPKRVFPGKEGKS